MIRQCGHTEIKKGHHSFRTETRQRHLCHEPWGKTHELNFLHKVLEIPVFAESYVLFLGHCYSFRFWTLYCGKLYPPDSVHNSIEQPPIIISFVWMSPYITKSAQPFFSYLFLGKSMQITHI